MGLRKLKTSITEGSNDGFVSRKQQRKNTKHLKKLQKIAHHKRKKFETITVSETKPAEKTRNKNKRENIIDKILAKNDELDKNEGYLAEIEEVTSKKRKQEDSEEDSDDELTYEQYLEEVKEKTRERQMDTDLAKDDDIAIHRYGKLLKLDKKKKIPKSFCDEGLDALLEFCDSENRKELLSKEGDSLVNDGNERETDDDYDENEELDENNIDLSEGEDDIADEEIIDEDFNEEEEDLEADFEDEKDHKTIAEDIYGRKIDRKTGELIKFDPQAARRKLEELDKRTGGDIENKQKIDRTITGIINRLSEATLIKSKQMFTELWNSNSKNDVKSALSNILWKMLGAPYRLQDSLISTYGLFLGLIHATVSSEISAYFIEEFLVDYVKSVGNDQERIDKSMENRTVLIANLMNFRIIKAGVILELFDKLLAYFNVDNLQLLYVLSVYSYKSMKKQCWNIFCEKLTVTLNKLQDSPLGCLPRAKFLGEQIGDLKKSPPSNIDLSITEQHQKMLYGLLKKEKTDPEKELGMSLEDLLLSEERGRWWIVGSAFRLSTDGSGDATHFMNETQQGPTFPQDLIELAQKAKMNTFVRRNIFCTIASASNEDEAFEKLLRLSLKGQQEREIIYVLIQMMLKEKQFNAYYPTLVTRFCNFDKRFKLTTQYAIWDRLREAGSLKQKARSHLALFIHKLIYTEVVIITVLKVVEWASIDSAISVILRKIFSQLGECPPNKLKRIFLPILDAKKDAVLSEGLRLFLQVNFPNLPIYQKVEEWFCGL